MIRQLTETDLPEMAELYVSVFASEPWNEQWKLSVVIERLTQFLTGRNSLAYGCFESNRLVGFVLGEHLPYLESRHFYIREMCVDSALQGTGIGSKLWNYLEGQTDRRNRDYSRNGTGNSGGREILPQNGVS